MSQDKQAVVSSASKTYELEKSVFVVAVADGYYRNRYWREGEKFRYDGRVKKNDKGEVKLPLWMKLDESAEANEIVLKGEKPKAKSSKPRRREEKKVSDLV